MHDDKKRYYRTALVFVTAAAAAFHVGLAWARMRRGDTFPLMQVLLLTVISIAVSMALLVGTGQPEVRRAVGAFATRWTWPLSEAQTHLAFLAGVLTFAIVLLVDGPAAAGLAAAGTAAAAVIAQRHQLTRLAERIAADEGEWTVFVNGVHVGTLSDAAYASSQAQVVGDVRAAWAQVFNLGQVALNVVWVFMKAAPITVFWTLAAYAVWAPEELRHLWIAVENGHAAELWSSSPLLIAAPLLYFSGALLVGGPPFGFVNHYKRLVNEAVRQRLNVAALGTVEVWPRVPGWPDQAARQ